MCGYLLALLPGLPISLSLTIVALIVGFSLAILFTALLSLRVPLLSILIRGYLFLFTGTPLLVQIFLIYYGSGYLPLTKGGLLGTLLSTPWFCAMIALALNSAAYSAQLFYHTLQSLPDGYRQACYALGMNHCQTLATLLPLTLKRALPAYGNEITLIFKSSSLASTITLMDLMGQALQLNNQTYHTLTIFTLTGACYLLISTLLSAIIRRLEQHLLAFDRS